MDDQGKTKEELIKELTELRLRIDRQNNLRSERSIVEKALLESEKKFRGLAEKLPNMVFINKKGRIVYVNERCEQVMGYNKKEFYSEDFDFISLIAPEYHKIVNNNFKRHLQGEEVPPYEYDIINKDGQKISAIHTTKLIDYEGEKAILGIVTDISERKRAEERLLKTQRNLDKAQAIAQLGSWEWDIKTNECVWSDHVYDIYGLSPGKDLPSYQIVLDTLSPECRHDFIKAVEDAVEHGKGFNGEYSIVRPDGIKRYTHAIGEVVRDRQGNPIKMFGVVQDITNITEVKKKLQLEQAQLKSVFDSINEVVYVSDIDTYEILFVNKHVERLFKDNVTGKKCYEEFQGFDKPCDFCTNKIIKGLKGEPYQWQYHNPIVNKDYDITDKIIKWHDGRDVRLELAIDITERRRSEDTVLNIVKGLSGVVGEKFFNSIVINMADLLEADYAYVAEIVPGRPNYMRTISFLAGGSFLENMEVDINGTPCEKVEGDGPCSFTTGIQKLFPKASTMAQLGVDAYSGIKLRDLSGKKIGLMAVMRKKPFENISLVETILKIFAVRVSSELERRKTEEALIASEKELKKNQAILEQKNAALREMLLQIELEKNKLQKNIDSNVVELIMPIVQRLESKGIDHDLITLLNKNLQVITSSFGSRVSELNHKLTSKEVEICNMIRSGLTSKDIGRSLNLSVQTIDTHRKNIRKKLKLSNKKSNLASYLKGL